MDRQHERGREEREKREGGRERTGEACSPTSASVATESVLLVITNSLTRLSLLALLSIGKSERVQFDTCGSKYDTPFSLQKGGKTQDESLRKAQTQHHQLVQEIKH